MGVKTYQAYTVAEALSAAKRDLGAQAVILETRTFKRGGVLGVGRRTIFELTATSGDRAELSAASKRRREHGVAAAAPATTAAAPATARSAVAAVADPARTRRLAQALAIAHDRRTQRPTAPVASPPAPPSLPAARLEASRRHPDAVALPVARRFILTPADARPQAPGHARGALRRAGSGGSEGRCVVGSAAAPPGEGEAMQQELTAIRAMVGRVLERQGGPRERLRADMPAGLFDMYLELLGQDLSEELADRIVEAVRDELGSEGWNNGAAVREAVLDHVARLVPVADGAVPDRGPDGRPRTIALIGPTGVGKTTTVAKLAASVKLRRRRRVGLVTCDTYRIAAVDQLRTYADIIGVPLEVALAPAEMSQAVHALRDCDVVLIDTPGRGANDHGRLDELRRFLAAADPHEVHLVLSSTAGQRVLLKEAEAFARAGADRIVLTKLDEAVSFGVLINVIQAVGKQLSFITTGQEVPDHIEPGRPRRLAELMLGAELTR